MSNDPASVAAPPASHSPAQSVGARDNRAVFREIPASNADTNVELNVCIELGRVRMRLSDVLQVSDGSVLELDKRADEMVDIVVNDRLIARGEVVVLNDKFAVRICAVMPAARDAHA